uniref:Uncharacterized protein n=1 Tax=Spongospora subterranea TaxID=70186 RepID=A0A0H5REA2_9EUKA|eukprot:CRZ12328.1 hypothetical protein [Spongospora subterranea]
MLLFTENCEEWRRFSDCGARFLGLFGRSGGYWLAGSWVSELFPVTLGGGTVARSGGFAKGETRGSGGFGFISGDYFIGKSGKRRGFWSCRSLAGIRGDGGRKVNE